jgi:hypothetical protein
MFVKRVTGRMEHTVINKLLCEATTVVTTKKPVIWDVNQIAHCHIQEKTNIYIKMTPFFHRGKVAGA